MNIAVMECYCLSKPVGESVRPVRGYRQTMHAVWKERGLPKITEQSLCDQARAMSALLPLTWMRSGEE